MTVSDNTIQAEGISSFSKNLGRISAKAGKIKATNVKKSLGRAFENTSNIATVAVTKNPKATLSSLPEIINFYHCGRDLYLPRFAFVMLYKWNKKKQILPI